MQSGWYKVKRENREMMNKLTTKDLCKQITMSPYWWKLI